MGNSQLCKVFKASSLRVKTRRSSAENHGKSDGFCQTLPRTVEEDLNSRRPRLRSLRGDRAVTDWSSVQPGLCSGWSSFLQKGAMLFLWHNPRSQSHDWDAVRNRAYSGKTKVPCWFSRSLTKVSEAEPDLLQPGCSWSAANFYNRYFVGSLGNQSRCPTR